MNRVDSSPVPSTRSTLESRILGNLVGVPFQRQYVLVEPTRVVGPGELPPKPEPRSTGPRLKVLTYHFSDTSGMPRPFLILHISDAHIGNPKYALDSQEVFRPFLEDLAQVRSDLDVSPDLIVFNGDLVFGEITQSAIAGQLEQAHSWIEAVYRATKSPSTTPLLLVPGNHDINRNVIGLDQKDWVSNLSDPQVLYGQMRDNTPLWQRFLERQSGWASFVARHPRAAQFTFEPSLNVSSGVLPHGTRRIGVVALNSSWASWRERELGDLWIGKYQLQHATNLLAGCDFSIIATHHPISWLNQHEQPWMEQRIQAIFRLHLHGHVHDQWYVPYEGHLRVQAGACYTDSTKENAYSWIELDFDSPKARLHFRTYSDKGKGGWGPLYIPGRTDDHGVAETATLFTTTQPAAVPTPEAPAQKTASMAPSGFSQISSLVEYIEAIETHFAFRWEPGEYDASSKARTLVYWPVRLRRPTPIHAVQAFTAAGLQRLGAEVVLWLDDLGNIETTIPLFGNTVKQWFNNVSGDFSKVKLRSFSEIITSDRGGKAWELLQSWLSDAKYHIEDILAISKLWPRDGDLTAFTELLGRKSRRILTPAAVWTCLFQTHVENPNCQILTLGGYDERALWEAWRDCAKTPLPVSHLFVPAMTEPDKINREQAVHMARARTNLIWDSKDDIRRALDDASTRSGSLSDGRLIPWSLQGCVQLPRFLGSLPPPININGKEVRGVLDFGGIEHGVLLSGLVDHIAQWMFRRVI